MGILLDRPRCYTEHATLAINALLCATVMTLRDEAAIGAETKMPKLL